MARGVLQAAIVAQVPDLGWQIAGGRHQRHQGGPGVAPRRHGARSSVAHEWPGVLQATILGQVADLGWQPNGRLHVCFPQTS